MKRNQLLFALFMVSSFGFSQTERDHIKTTLSNYIEGTSYNNIERIQQAFYAEANLYLENKEKEPWIVPAEEYINWFKKGKEGHFNGRIGNILSIDYNNSVAMAKAEIIIPNKKIRYVDMFLLKKVKQEWKIISKSASSQESNLNGDRILFIVSNAHYYGNSQLPAGNSYSEIVNAYDTFVKAGYTVDFVSPSGGSIPLAYINTSDTLQKKYLYDQDFMYSLNHTNKPIEIRPENYKAVHYIGGGSAMFGVPENAEIQKIVMTIYEEHNGIISSVCHGTAGIVNLKTKNGEYLVTGKKVNGYPDEFERKGAEYFNQFPFLITRTIEERGGIFRYSPRNHVHIEEDGNLITGQNYLSSGSVALKIIEKLKNSK
jgi:putative intracellular protease/amidase